MKSKNLVWNRRDFLKVGGTSTAALGVAGTAALPIEAAQAPATQSSTPPDTPYPKLSIITPYSPQKLAFAAQAGYEGVVVTPGPDFNPNLSDGAIDQIQTTARNAGRLYSRAGILPSPGLQVCRHLQRRAAGRQHAGSGCGLR
jgi:hypothetical protein